MKVRKRMFNYRALGCKRKTPGHWQVIGASARGSAHEKRDLPCQDVCCWTNREGILVAAVADGASFAPFGEWGSAHAAQASVDALAEKADLFLCDPQKNAAAWSNHLMEAIKIGVKATEKEAERMQVPHAHLATTLILVVATPGATFAAQIGDGAVTVFDQNGVLTNLTVPSKGEYQNETVFLRSTNLSELAQVRIWTMPPRYIALFSDGLERLALKMPGAIPHSPFFDPLFQFMSKAMDEAARYESLKIFLESSRVRSRTDDDVTLLLANFIGG